MNQTACLSGLINAQLHLHPLHRLTDVLMRKILCHLYLQVHTATLKSGEKVAVKIQHEGLVDTSSADIKTIQYLVSAAHHFFPKFNYQWLVDEIKHNLPRELDFKMEAANIERCRDNFAYHSQVHVPHVYPEFATSRILTMSFEEGHHIDQRDQLDANGIDRKEVAALVSSVFSEQIFVHGFVHCGKHM